jgi:serpin B
LSTVAQSVFVAVDEHGTEAAAVTGGAMTTSAPVPFEVDRPFAFAIVDRSTGAILFLGTINDPRR